MATILGVCGSPRKAATYYSLVQALEAAEAVDGVQTDLISLRGKDIRFCIHCDKCVREEATHCVLHNDDMQDFYEPFFQADGFLIATPVYSMGISCQLSTFFSRFRANYIVLRDNPDFFTSKAGAALAVGGTRNGGQEMAINAIHGFYHTNGILVVNGGLLVYGGGAVWSRDRRAQGAEEDEIGMNNCRTVGRKLAETVKVLTR